LPRILASIDPGGVSLAGDIVGREPELATLEGVLDAIEPGPTALLLSGDAGIGKTTVWRRGLTGALSSAAIGRSVLEQAVDLSMAGPARGRVLLDLGMGLAETEGWRGAWAAFEAARSDAGDDLALRALVEQNLGYAWLW
jgi:AAA ATPase-like protein